LTRDRLRRTLGTEAVAREAKAMTAKEVIVKAIEGRLTWLQAADILGYSPRHMRLKKGRAVCDFERP